MSYKQQPFSFIYQQGDKDKWLDVHKALNPAVFGIINDYELFKRALREMPKTRKAWIRFYHDDDGVWWQKGNLEYVKRIVKQYRDAGIEDDRALLYISNEPAPGDPNKIGEAAYINNVKQIGKLHVDALDYVNSLGIGAVVLNSTAAFRQADINDGYLDPLLKRLADKTVENVQGHHQYGAIRWQMSCAGRLAHQIIDKAQNQNSPSPYDVQFGSKAGNWLTGRHYWFDDRCDVLGIERPLKMDTENSPSDRHNSYENAKYPDDRDLNVYRVLEQRYKRKQVINGKEIECIVPWPHERMRGQDTVRWVYEDYFPGIDFEDVLFIDMQWLAWVNDDYQLITPEITRRKPYMTEPTWLGATLFIWSPEKDDWDREHGFDWSKYNWLHKRLTAWSRDLERVTQPPPPPPPPTPEPPPPVPVPPTVPPEPPQTGDRVLDALIALNGLKSALDTAARFSEEAFTVAIEKVNLAIDILENGGK